MATSNVEGIPEGESCSRYRWDCKGEPNQTLSLTLEVQPGKTAVMQSESYAEHVNRVVSIPTSLYSRQKPQKRCSHPIGFYSVPGDILVMKSDSFSMKNSIMM